METKQKLEVVSPQPTMKVEYSESGNKVNFLCQQVLLKEEARLIEQEIGDLLSHRPWNPSFQGGRRPFGVVYAAPAPREQRQLAGEGRSQTGVICFEPFFAGAFLGLLLGRFLGWLFLGL